MNIRLSCATIILLAGSPVSSFTVPPTVGRNESPALTTTAPPLPRKMAHAGGGGRGEGESEEQQRGDAAAASVVRLGRAVRSVLGAFGVAGAILTSSIGAHAAGGPVNIDAIPSSSSLDSSTVRISAEIKTMDLSMPSSYGAISGATVSGTDELTVVENVATGTKRKAAPKPKKDDGGGSMMGGFGRQMTDEEKAAMAAERQAQREAEKAEKEAIAAEKAAEREALKAEKEAMAAEKAAERAAEQKVKEAEKAAAREAAKEVAVRKAEEKESQKSQKAYKGAEFVDMALPSYSDSAPVSGEKNSFFAL